MNNPTKAVIGGGCMTLTALFLFASCLALLPVSPPSGEVAQPGASEPPSTTRQKTPDITDAPEATNTPDVSSNEDTVEGRVTQTPTHTPKPQRTQAPRSTRKPVTTDKRYATCAAAKRAGKGPYYRGVDPEYHWYQDRDKDGSVCE